MKGRGSGKKFGLTMLAIVVGLLALGVQIAGATPGQLDRSFGGGIVAVQPPNGPYTSWAAMQGAPGPNGSAYVLERETRCGFGGFECLVDIYLTRYLKNGKRDQNYAGSGRNLVTEELGIQGTSFGVDGTGSLVVAWTNGKALTATRIDAEGSVDRTFGSGGIATVGCGCSVGRVRLLIGRDGKITLTAPEAPLSNGGYGYPSFEGTLVARLTPRGALDPDFGNGGRVLVSANLDGPWALRANGAVIATEISDRSYLVKISPDGQEVVRDWAVSLRQRAVRMFQQIMPLPNGDLAIVGTPPAGRGVSAVARLRPSGVLKRGFGKAGVIRFSKRFAYGAGVDAQGRILLAGTIESARKMFAMRLFPNGAVDRRFRNGLGGIRGGESRNLEVMFSGARPLIFNEGGESCRGYCRPHPFLYKLKGGPAKKPGRR
ncbi:MAG TPA: hypothetical protein VIT85_06730 [Solirubrobacterales bacterium]